MKVTDLRCVAFSMRSITKTDTRLYLCIEPWALNPARTGPHRDDPGPVAKTGQPLP